MALVLFARLHSDDWTFSNNEQKGAVSVTANNAGVDTTATKTPAMNPYKALFVIAVMPVTWAVDNKALIHNKVTAALRGDGSSQQHVTTSTSLPSDFHATVASVTTSWWNLYQGTSTYAQDYGALATSTCLNPGETGSSILHFTQQSSGNYYIITPAGYYLCAPEATAMWYPQSEMQDYFCQFAITPSSGGTYHIALVSPSGSTHNLRVYVDQGTGMSCLGNLAAWYGSDVCNVYGTDYCQFTFQF